MTRPGKTLTVSISLAAEPLKVLRRRAKFAHRGNLSAAVAEAADYLRRDLAMGELIAQLENTHGPLTAKERGAFDTELQSPTGRTRRKARAA
jgi:hypothetical protein